jgi:PPOX class probable F420-dependent enzyme
MMPARIGERLAAFLHEVNPIMLGTSRGDGTVHLTPVWFEYRDGNIWINGAASRDWLTHLRRDDRASLLVVDGRQILRRAEMQGRVVSIAHDEGNVQINRLAQRYRGRDFGSHGDERITVQIELVRVTGADGQIAWDVD